MRVPSAADSEPLEDEAPERALVEARALEARGELTAAIAAYSAANRRSADARIERALVALRRKAFVAARAARLGEDAPPSTLESVEAPAIDPGVGLPVVQGSVSANTLRAAIDAHGSLIVRGLLSPARAASLRTATAAANAAREAMQEGRATPDDSAWYHEFADDPDANSRAFTSSDGVLAADSPRGLFELIEAFRDAGLDRLARDFLGAEPALAVEKSVLRRVTPQWAASWHQDGAFLGERIRTLDAWIALTPCGITAPGLELLPRRVDRVLPTGAFFSWDLSWETIGREFPGFTTVSPVFEPGDAIFFDQLCVHRSGHREGMTEARLAVECWFFAAADLPAGYTGLSL